MLPSLHDQNLEILWQPQVGNPENNFWSFCLHFFIIRNHRSCQLGHNSIFIFSSCFLHFFFMFSSFFLLFFFIVFGSAVGVQIASSFFLQFFHCFQVCCGCPNYIFIFSSLFSLQRRPQCNGIWEPSVAVPNLDQDIDSNSNHNHKCIIRSLCSNVAPKTLSRNLIQY